MYGKIFYTADKQTLLFNFIFFNVLAFFLMTSVMQQCKSQHSHFIFRKSQVPIFLGKLAILVYYSWFCSTTYANVGMLFLNKPEPEIQVFWDLAVC